MGETTALTILSQASESEVDNEKAEMQINDVDVESSLIVNGDDDDDHDDDGDGDDDGYDENNIDIEALTETGTAAAIAAAEPVKAVESEGNVTEEEVDEGCVSSVEVSPSPLSLYMMNASGVSEIASDNISVSELTNSRKSDNNSNNGDGKSSLNDSSPCASRLSLVDENECLKRELLEMKNEALKWKRTVMKLKIQQQQQRQQQQQQQQQQPKQSKEQDRINGTPPPESLLVKAAESRNTGGIWNVKMGFRRLALSLSPQRSCRSGADNQDSPKTKTSVSTDGQDSVENNTAIKNARRQKGIKRNGKNNSSNNNNDNVGLELSFLEEHPNLHHRHHSHHYLKPYRSLSQEDSSDVGHDKDITVANTLSIEETSFLLNGADDDDEDDINRLLHSQKDDNDADHQETLQSLKRPHKSFTEEVDTTKPPPSNQLGESMSFCEQLRTRSGWLVGLLVLQSMSSFILKNNEHLLRRHAVIVQFLTMLVGAGGNAGNQASVRVIRGLATGNIHDENMRAYFIDELRTAVFLSTILGVAGCCRAAIFLTPVLETVAITASLISIVIISIIIGTALPVAMHFIGIDPAHSSTTIQVIMDILGVTITVHVSGAILPNT